MVDDSSLMRKLIREAIAEDKKFEVQTASSGPSALAMMTGRGLLHSVVMSGLLHCSAIVRVNDYSYHAGKLARCAKEILHGLF